MPYEREHRRNRRKDWLIEHLEASHVVQVTCTKCGHQALLAPHELHARYKRSVGLAALRLKCKACGSYEVSWQVLRARPPLTARDH